MGSISYERGTPADEKSVQALPYKENLVASNEERRSTEAELSGDGRFGERRAGGGGPVESSMRRNGVNVLDGAAVLPRSRPHNLHLPRFAVCRVPGTVLELQARCISIWLNPPESLHK